MEIEFEAGNLIEIVRGQSIDICEIKNIKDDVITLVEKYQDRKRLLLLDEFTSKGFQVALIPSKKIQVSIRKSKQQKGV